jgi:hypothetical protein
MPNPFTILCGDREKGSAGILHSIDQEFLITKYVAPNQDSRDPLECHGYWEITHIREKLNPDLYPPLPGNLQQPHTP